MNRVFRILICVGFWALLNSPVAFGDVTSIRVASATTIENSGLYTAILPAFTKQTGINVRVHSVGTGHAIKMARSGDADILLGHHQPSEQQFVDQGFGVERFDVMYNDFVLVGPADDPARVRGTRNIHEALERIARKGSRFISRADDSGTHKKERSIWHDLAIDVSSQSGKWYLETGTGMGATLNIANGLGAYTLSDRGTWLKFSNRIDLRLLLDGDPALFNQYGVVLVSPEAHAHTNVRDANAFVQWLLSERGQSAIDSYLINGEQAFFANAHQDVRLGQNAKQFRNIPRLDD